MVCTGGIGNESILTSIQDGILKDGWIIGTNTSDLFNNGTINIDNETLPIFQDFILVLDSDLGNLSKPGEITLENILNSMKGENPGVKIVFDPDSLVFGLQEEVSDTEAEILNSIKDEINTAVQKIAESCGGQLCIQSVTNNSTTINAVNITQLFSIGESSKPIEAPGPIKDNDTRVVIIEPKNEVQAQLSFCLNAIQCIDPVPCMFAQSKCLQVSGIELLEENKRRKLFECQVDSLLCSLQSLSISGQMECESMFKDCGVELGIDIVDGTIVRVHDIQDTDLRPETQTVPAVQTKPSTGETSTAFSFDKIASDFSDGSITQDSLLEFTSKTVSSDASSPSLSRAGGITTILSSTTEDSSLTLSTAVDTTPTSSSSDDATPTPSSSVDTTPTPSSLVDTTPTPSSSVDTTLTPSSSVDTTPTPSSSGDTTPTPSSSGDTTPTPSSSGDTTLTPSSSVNTTPTPSSLVDTTSTPTSSVDTNPTPSSSVNTTSTPSSSGYKTSTPSSPVDTTPTPSSSFDTTPTPSSSGYTTPTSSSAVDTTPIPSSSGDKAPTPSSSGDIPPNPSSSVDTTPTPSSSVDSTPTPSSSGDTDPTPSKSVDTIPTPSSSVDSTPNSSSSGDTTFIPSSSVDSTPAPSSSVDTTPSPSSSADIASTTSSSLDLTPTPYSSGDTASTTSSSVDSTPSPSNSVDSTPYPSTTVDTTISPADQGETISQYDDTESNTIFADDLTKTANDMAANSADEYLNQNDQEIINTLIENITLALDTHLVDTFDVVLDNELVGDEDRINLSEPNVDEIVNIVKDSLTLGQTTIPLSINSSSDFEINLPKLGFTISIREEYYDNIEDVNETNTDSEEFGLSYPDFGFNVTAVKDITQCMVEGVVFDDFEFIPSTDQCEICQCIVGKIECYVKSCDTQIPTGNCISRQEPGNCCPNYVCHEDQENPLDQLDQDEQDDLENQKNNLKEGISEGSDLFITDEDSQDNIEDGFEGSGGVEDPEIGLASAPSTGLGRQEELPVNIDDAKDILNSVKTTIMDIFANATSIFKDINLSSEVDTTPTNTTDSETNKNNNALEDLNNGKNTSLETAATNQEFNLTDATLTMESVTSLNIPENTVKPFEEVTLPSFDVTLPVNHSDTDMKTEKEAESTTGIFNAIGIDLAENEDEKLNTTETDYSDDILNGANTTGATGIYEKVNEVTTVQTQTELATDDLKPEISDVDNQIEVTDKSDIKFSTVKEDEYFLKVTTTEKSDSFMSENTATIANSVVMEEAIGKKDVRVFLNFTWKGDNFQIEEVFDDDKFQGNITDKLMKILNHGVGYVIVPDGEFPEIDTNNTVELVQTIQLDFQDNIVIDTMILGTQPGILHPEDLKYISNIEQKTKDIVKEIFQSMEDEILQTTESSFDSNENAANFSTIEETTDIPTTTSQNDLQAIKDANTMSTDLKFLFVTMKSIIESDSATTLDATSTIGSSDSPFFNPEEIFEDFASNSNPRTADIIRIGQKVDADNNAYFKIQIHHDILTADQAKKAKNIIIAILKSSFGEKVEINESDLSFEFIDKADLKQIIKLHENTVQTYISELDDEQEVVYREIFDKIEALLTEENEVPSNENTPKPSILKSETVAIVSIQSPFDISPEDLKNLKVIIRENTGINSELFNNPPPEVLLSQLNTKNNSIFIDTKIDKRGNVNSNFFQNQISYNSLEDEKDGEDEVGSLGVLVSEEIKKFIKNRIIEGPPSSATMVPVPPRSSLNSSEENTGDVAKATLNKDFAGNPLINSVNSSQESEDIYSTDSVTGKYEQTSFEKKEENYIADENEESMEIFTTTESVSYTIGGSFLDEIIEDSAIQLVMNTEDPINVLSEVQMKTSIPAEVKDSTTVVGITENVKDNNVTGIKESTTSNVIAGIDESSTTNSLDGIDESTSEISVAGIFGSTTNRIFPGINESTTDKTQNGIKESTADNGLAVIYESTADKTETGIEDSTTDKSLTGKNYSTTANSLAGINKSTTEGNVAVIEESILDSIVIGSGESTTDNNAARFNESITSDINIAVIEESGTDRTVTVTDESSVAEIKESTADSIVIESGEKNTEKTVSVSKENDTDSNATGIGESNTDDSVAGIVESTADNSLVGLVKSTTDISVDKIQPRTTAKSVVGINESATDTTITKLNEITTDDSVAGTDESTTNNIVARVKESATDTSMAELDDSTTGDSVVEFAGSTTDNSVTGNDGSAIDNSVAGMEENTNKNSFIGIEEITTDNIVTGINESTTDTIVTGIEEKTTDNIVTKIGESPTAYGVAGIDKSTTDNSVVKTGESATDKSVAGIKESSTIAITGLNENAAENSVAGIDEGSTTGNSVTRNDNSITDNIVTGIGESTTDNSISGIYKSTIVNSVAGIEESTNDNSVAGIEESTIVNSVAGIEESTIKNIVAGFKESTIDNIVFGFKESTTANIVNEMKASVNIGEEVEESSPETILSGAKESAGNNNVTGIDESTPETFAAGMKENTMDEKEEDISTDSNEAGIKDITTEKAVTKIKYSATGITESSFMINENETEIYSQSLTEAAETFDSITIDSQKAANTDSKKTGSDDEISKVYDDDVSSDYNDNIKEDTTESQDTTNPPANPEFIDENNEVSVTQKTTTSKVFNLQTTIKPPSDSKKIQEKIIETLAKLFVKTLDLSIKIKSAIDENSKNNILEIVSRKDENETPPESFVVPNLIKITPEDAVEIRNDPVETEGEIKPIIILIEDNNNLIINDTNGNVLELDFSDLPTDPVDRENIIRSKIRDLLQDVFITPEVSETFPKTSLSDEIIKNITQIVLLKMEESLSSLPNLKNVVLNQDKMADNGSDDNFSIQLENFSKQGKLKLSLTLSSFADKHINNFLLVQLYSFTKCVVQFLLINYTVAQFYQRFKK